VTTFTASWPVLHAVAGAVWKDDPTRIALAVLGVAFGVALGVAVHLINFSAAAEFDRAVRSLSGEANALVRGPRSGFPDAVYARITRLAGVRAASPAVEAEAQVAGHRESIKVLGIDALRAAVVQPHLLPDDRAAVLELLKGGTVILSHAAAAHFGLGAAATLRLHVGSGFVALRVAAVLPAGATQQRIAIMDIADAQWRLDRLGEIHRIDVLLAPGMDVTRFREAASRMLPPGVIIASPGAEAQRNASMARAYRVNLQMLALVALMTGAFLVFSTQFLALLRRRTQLALLRVVGLTRGRLTRLLVAEGCAVGVLGSALGLGLGIGIARLAIERLGGDLGAGYFRAVTPELTLDALTLAGYVALGVLFSAAGAAVAALEAARRRPALALRAGDEEAALRRLRSGFPGIALIVAGLGVSLGPPLAELPVFGYAAIALILLGAILAMPRLSELVLALLPRVRYVPASLAAAQLQATPRQAAISVAAIVASFSLMVSMVIMTASFRASLERWLDRMLPADLYVRAGRLGDTGYFTIDEQQRLTALPVVADALFGRTQNVMLREDRPAITLLARPFANGHPRPELPVRGSGMTPLPEGPPGAWLSEVAADLLGVRVGDTLELPVGHARRTFVVAGIWRDYARQNGSIVIDRALYIALTGDERANEGALYLDSGVSFEEAARRVRAAFPPDAGLEIASTRELKEISLGVFDRTFAVTYALEAAAVLIGLFGVSASFSAQALARRREFGVLRHIGMRRREIASMLGCEGLIVGALGVGAGVAVGWLVSVILIHVVNRQSFHWSMDMDIPWTLLGALGACLLGAASVTAIVSGRRAMSTDMVRAVREDW